MRTLFNWTAKRAGAHQTVYGFDGGEDVKITQVTSLTGVNSQSHVIATTKDGEEIRLWVGAR